MKENLDKGIGWLQRLVDLQNKYGFFSIVKGLIILLLAGYVVFFALNPRYLLDKMETVQAQRHDDAVTRRLNADADIRVMLSRLLHTLDADRVWLIELHNGSKNLSSGLPFLYGDMRIEETAEGIANVDEEYHNFSLSKYPFIAQVFDNGYFWGPIDSVRKTDERLFFKFKANDLNELALLALYAGDKPLGLLGISFCGEKRMNPLLTGRHIRKCGIQIASLLSDYKKL